MQCTIVTAASQAASSSTKHFSVTDIGLGVDGTMASLQDGREERELNKQIDQDIALI